MNFMNRKELFLLEEVVRKDFSSKYKDSKLGLIWSVLNPLLMVITLTIVFSTMLGKGIENYPVYLISGRYIFSYFTTTVGGSMGIIKSNKNVLKRTAAPKYIFVLGKIISEFINSIISFILLIIIMIVTGAPFHFLLIPFSIIPVISVTFMITGFSFMMSIVASYYSDVKHLWRVFSQMLMYCSAIFYLMDRIPEPYRQYLLLNPLYWAINQFRSFMVFGVVPDLLNIINLILLSLIIFVIGIIIFEKYENKVILKL